MLRAKLLKKLYWVKAGFNLTFRLAILNFSGSWLSFLQFDGDMFWKITDKVP